MAGFDQRSEVPQRHAPPKFVVRKRNPGRQPVMLAHYFGTAVPVD